MHASTQLYLELQRCYRDKAEEDAAQGERVKGKGAGGIMQQQNSLNSGQGAG